MARSVLLLTLISIVLWFCNITFGYKSNEEPLQYVSPPFGRVAAQAYDMDDMKLLLNDPENYNPGWGKFGITMSILYYARNARLAAQYYDEPDKLWINNENYQTIWSKTFRFEMDIFSKFREWHDARNENDKNLNWKEFVNTVYNIFDGDLRDYIRHFMVDDIHKIKMPIYTSNRMGIKYLLKPDGDFELPSDIKFDAINPYIPSVKLGVDGAEKEKKFPLIGFGTWPLTGDKCKNAVLMALKTGYRLLDTSENYNNEEKIGEAMKESGINRNEILIATKLSYNKNYGKDVTTAAFYASLDKLGVDYIDIYMTHGAISDKQRLRETWQELEELYISGKIKYLGVSNYSPRDMEELYEYAKILPTFVQNKFDPFTQGQQAPWTASINKWVQNQNIIDKDIDLVGYDYNIIVQGYCLLNSWPHKVSAVNDLHIEWIANKYDKSSAQLLIRWALQNNIAVLTRSSSEERQISNLNVFDFKISDVDMQLINGLNTLFSPFDLQSIYDVYGQVSNRPNPNHNEL